MSDALTPEQQQVTELASRILSGILAGQMAANAKFDLGSVRPHHVQGSVNLALALLAEVRQRVPSSG